VSGFLALLPGFPQNPQPRDLSSGRHPSGKTANLRHWYLVPRLFSLAFPETHNPLFQPEAATPTGRRSITAILPRISMPAVFAVLVSGHLFRGLSPNPQPRKTAEDSHPFGETVNPGCVKTISSPNYHMANSSIFRNHYLFTPSFYVIVHENLGILEF